MKKPLKTLCGGLSCFIVLAVSSLSGQKMTNTGAENVGGPTVMRRLTAVQYRNIITDVFGDTIALGGRFEPELHVEFLSAIGAGRASVSASGLEQYDGVGRSVGAQVVDPEHRDQLIDCNPVVTSEPDDACARHFLDRVGRLLYRRPLAAKELDAYAGAASVATRKTKDFYSGLGIALGGMLESPQFLFRQEFSEPDPAHSGMLRLDSYSKASRLSFLLWNTAPDTTLLTAAEKGELETRQGLARQVDRLLSSLRLEMGVRSFFADMLEFDGFNTLAKDTMLYPKFTVTTMAETQEQTLRTLVQVLLRENGDYRDIFTTRETFLTPLLGSLYGVPVLSPDGLPTTWVPYDFAPSSGQSGILTQASFVALHSHPGRSSPTLRGRALREVLLCSKVPDPPGNVNITVVQDTSNPQYKTARARLGVHATEAMCAGCHKFMDPMGLALENFDTVGGHRDTENGVRIDASGELDGVKYDDAQGLGKAVHDNPRTAACLVQRTLDYALGRVETESEKRWRSEYLNKKFVAEGYRFPALLRSIAMSDTFYSVLPGETAVIAAAQTKTPKESDR